MTTPIRLTTGVVKQVVSGDTIVVRDKPKDQKPHEKTVVLMNIVAPKMGRKKRDAQSEKDEPFAFEAREFLRKKLIGQEVKFMTKPFPNATSGSSERERGRIFFPEDNDIAEELVANGWAEVKKPGGKAAQDADIKRLCELEEKARKEEKGKFKRDRSKAVRNVTYVQDYKKFFADFQKKTCSAIIEQVRDSQVVMILEVLLLPTHHCISFAISGIKFNPDAYGVKEEAKFFVECRLLQQSDIQVVIEKEFNNYVSGSVIHPKGNIAELLLKEGFVQCDDRTMSTVTTGASKLRAAEAFAKENRLRIWRDRKEVTKTATYEFPATVAEIISAEILIVRPCTGNREPKKIFLSGIRGPKEQRKEGNEDKPRGNEDKPRGNRSIFDVPWQYEAKEFLRKKLIGKRVTVTVDYKQEASNSYPEKTCCTVLIGNSNIAELLVLEGLATVVHYYSRSDSTNDTNRPASYDALMEAEQKAKESQKGLHSKVDPPKPRLNDCTGPLSQGKAIGLFPMLHKASRITAIVEFVISGNRMRLFIPKDMLMITFSLSGIVCPRPANKRNNVEGEPLGDEALEFTKKKILQREVDIQIEAHDKVGAMIGSLFIGNSNNLALMLVEEGLASVHSTCQDRTLQQAEKVAKEKKIGIWEHEQESKKEIGEEEVVERTLNYRDVTVTIVSPELHIFVHHSDQKGTLDELEDKLRADLASNPPVVYSKEKPPLKGKWCAAKFDEDNLWYRGKVEKVMGGATCRAIVNFVDYGNRASIAFEDLAPLSDVYASAKPFAHEYALACVAMPPEHYLNDVASELYGILEKRNLQINTEYQDHNLHFVSIYDPKEKEDVIKTCIAKGLFYVQNRREKKLASLIKEYVEAQNEAKLKRHLIWEYGDARADDAKEFGLGK